MDLSHSENLKELPNLSTATNLKELDLSECSSLVELPFSIGNLHKLLILHLKGCSKLKALPININMKSLHTLDLTDCCSLKSFPEISTNIATLHLIGTSIKEVPWSIRSWSRLDTLHMPYSENLKKFPSIHHSITELDLSDTGIHELGPWIRGLTGLDTLVLNGMRNLVSLPQLPDSLMFLEAGNCESLEKLDLSLCNRIIRLNFRNCFKLNQEARDFIIQTSTCEVAVLPGGEVPACFTYRASGSSVTVKFDQKPLHTSTKFKACILFVNKDENDARDLEQMTRVSCSITSKQNARTAKRSHERYLYKILEHHLYIFDVEAEEVTSTQLVFEFDTNSKTWEIKECGILHLLEHHVDEEDSESFRGGDEEIVKGDFQL